MCGAIPPIHHTTSCCAVWLSTRTAIPLGWDQHRKPSGTFNFGLYGFKYTPPPHVTRKSNRTLPVFSENGPSFKNFIHSMKHMLLRLAYSSYLSSFFKITNSEWNTNAYFWLLPEVWLLCRKFLFLLHVSGSLILFFRWNRGSSISVVTRLPLDDRVRFSAGKGFFSLRPRVQAGSGAHLASYSKGIGGAYPGVKAAEAWSWPLTSI
jgi:hypothetical protein